MLPIHKDCLKCQCKKLSTKKLKSCWKNCYSSTQEDRKPVLKPIMVRIDTLNELSQLRDSGFGQPRPRHGLNLLYWFAHDYVEIDSYGRMTPKTSPAAGAYGFHRFHNFKDEDDYLLPSQNLPYYGVGNLGESKAHKLPLYVRKNYTHDLDGSNKDRIMVRLKDGYLERVYITEHIDQTSNKACVEHNTQNRLLNKALSMVRTLNELAQLRNSSFGQPSPRHGRKLLYWFACECVEIDNGRMTIQCKPEEGDFGFHRFHNRIEDDEERLLPNRDLPYYEVGNLTELQAENLPNYVKENYNPSKRASNTDRIIVCLNDSAVEKIYATEHQDQRNFNPKCTYRISQGLLQTIRNKTRKDFLRETECLHFIPQCLKMPLSVVRLATPTSGSGWISFCFLAGELCGEAACSDKLQSSERATKGRTDFILWKKPLSLQSI
ncbi:hypothetical protein AOLI_G00193660 [Acnodon oligacanthus]